MARDIITNEQWKRLRPLLPPQKPKTGRPAKNHRVVVNGILWLMRTGAPWRDLPTEYGPWQTVASRFYRWRRAGVWEHILQTLQQQTDANGQIDWEKHYLDSTVIRAHQHASGAKRRGRDEALGRSQGGIGTKVHLRAEGGGKPMVFVLTAGQRHEQVDFWELMEEGEVKRPGRGRPKSRTKRVVADKAYNSGKVRRYLRQRHVGIVIPRQRHKRQREELDGHLYLERNRGERMINRLKQFRRVATRYEKQTANYLAILTLAAIVISL
jgi:transposase